MIFGLADSMIIARFTSCRTLLTLALHLCLASVLVVAGPSFANNAISNNAISNNPLSNKSPSEGPPEKLSATAKSTPVGTLAYPAIQQGLGLGARFVGGGELTWFGFRLYEAQLWVAEKSDLGSHAKPGQATSYVDQNFALDLRYQRNFSGEAIADRSLAEIQKLGIGNAEQHQSWLAHMKKLLPSVKKGDRITGVHLAGVGVSFYLNDKLLGRVDDAGFANAFFAIWLDPKTSAPGLRAALLSAKPT